MATKKKRMREVETTDCCYWWKLLPNASELCKHSTWTDWIEETQDGILRAMRIENGKRILSIPRAQNILVVDGIAFEVRVHWYVHILRELDKLFVRDCICAIWCLRKHTVPSLPPDIVRYIIRGYVRPDQRKTALSNLAFLVKFPTQFDDHESVMNQAIKELGW